MKIHIDEANCVGAGQCALSAPTIFDLRDDDGVAYLVRDPGMDDEEQVREAADLCPTLAIVLADS